MQKYNAVMYLRISNADETNGESLSLGNQRSIILDFIERNPDIKLVDEFFDDGVTGLVYDRVGLNSAMDMICSGKANCIITKDLSRLGREYIDTGKYLKEVFPKYGVRFIAVTDNIDTKTEGVVERLDVQLKTLLNDAFSRDIGNKTRSALRSKRSRGEYVGANPIYGYKRCEENKNKLVVDEEAGVIVKEIFNFKKSGYSAKKIAEILNEKCIASPYMYKKENGKACSLGGYSNKENTMWSATTILRMLSDKTYTGALVQGKTSNISYKIKKTKIKPLDEWEIIPNTHEAIISETDFNLVQKLKNLDTRTSPVKTGVYVFSGLLVCGCCGRSMTRKTTTYKDKKYYNYICPTGKKNGCDSKMIKEDKLISCITESVRTYVNSVMDYEKLYKKISDEALDERKRKLYDKQLEALLKGQDEQNKYKSKLYENLADNLITKADYQDLKKGYDNKLEKINKAITSLNLEYEEYKSKTQNETIWIENVTEFQNMETITRKILVGLVEHITLILRDEKEIKIKFRYENEFNSLLNILSEVEKGVA